MVDQLTELKDKDIDRSLFPSSLTIRALRDSRYHSSAYAIAELIDNSIEAGAEQIDLLCMEQHQRINAQTRPRIIAIAVLDNGTGMDVETLLDALKFGGGTRHHATSGIGKYGMGLPTASMSQGKRVDVWTWQDGIESVWHSSIDADSIEQGDHSVPWPDQSTPIPDEWKIAGNSEIFGHHSGTLVVWSKLDKIQWKIGRTIIDHVYREVGRIHRHFINIDLPRVHAASFIDKRPAEVTYESNIVANDPLYLMSDTSTPAPWDKEPMFKEWGEPKYYTYIVDGKETTIEVKYSIVKAEALETDSVNRFPGRTDRGRHARHNLGVSVVREEREIVLEDAFLREGGSSTNPQNRWWGCEVHFRRGCDDLFGLDPNKQQVSNFTQAAKTLASDDRPNQVILNELGIENDLIYEIVGKIRDETRAMMRAISKMFEQRRPKSPNRGYKNPETKAVVTATGADKDAVASGNELPTKTDKERDEIPSETREAGLADHFVEFGQSDQDAKQLAKMIVQEGFAYQFNPDQLDGYQIFNVRSNHGVLHINLNMDHPIYDLIKHIEGRIGDSVDENDPAFQSIVAIRLLLSSWARMEDQTESREERMQIQHVAMRWGQQVDKMISYLRDRED